MVGLISVRVNLKLFNKLSVVGLELIRTMIMVGNLKAAMNINVIIIINQSFEFYNKY